MQTPYMPLTFSNNTTNATNREQPNFNSIALKILLFSRELDIIDYGDGITKQKLQVTYFIYIIS